jgi:pimeloyl-ACP methyl ester carboxylesterase
VKIILSHGKESGPWGSKITALADVTKTLDASVKIEVESIDYTQTMDPDQRAEILRKSLDRDDLILVGSSMGGYVSTVAAQQYPVMGLFLMAPAFYMPGYDIQDFEKIHCPVTVIHGWRDEIITHEHSVRFAREQRANLIIVDSDHGLASAHLALTKYFRLFLLDIIDRRTRLSQ